MKVDVPGKFNFGIQTKNDGTLTLVCGQPSIVKG
jgi:hypothetical protein